MLPCLIFEDEHLLVVNKPAGLNTHAPSPYAGEGLYDWLRQREPRWANLAIIHRLDKETSGVMIFTKTPLANRSLTEQFTRRAVHKKYLLLTDHPAPTGEFTVKSSLIRAGDKYVSRPPHPGGELAKTRFKPLVGADVRRLFSEFQTSTPSPHLGSCTVLEAEPLTGRTHQIRVHAAEKGFPILGDTLYGGAPAQRVCLHAAEIRFQHPATGQDVTFTAPVDFGADARLLARTALLDPQATNASRLVHGASDGWPGWYVERLGNYLLSQSEQSLSAEQRKHLACLMEHSSARGAYHKFLSRHICKTSSTEASPQLVLGEPAPERFTILENGLAFELSFQEGYSVGLFLDQRDNRRRLLTGYVGPGFSLFQPAPPKPCSSGRESAPSSPAGEQSRLTSAATAYEVLNTFAYTCAFSVSAARAGARTTSLDLSKKYLEWGKRNFALNQLDPAQHDFIYGDAFEWFRRLARKGRRFDAIVLDPPTFSQSKESGAFRAKRDYGKLVAAALPLLKSPGVLLASTNAADWAPEEFLSAVAAPFQAAHRKILQQQYIPQPPDFPVSRAEPAYLKTVWMRA